MVTSIQRCRNSGICRFRLILGVVEQRCLRSPPAIRIRYSPTCNRFTGGNGKACIHDRSVVRCCSSDDVKLRDCDIYASKRESGQGSLSIGSSTSLIVGQVKIPSGVRESNVQKDASECPHHQWFPDIAC